MRKKRCAICKSELVKPFSVKEMMLGLRTSFTYATCSSCNSLQLTNPPSHFDRYYSDHYYSYANKTHSRVLAQLTYGLLQSPLRTVALWGFNWLPEYRFPYYAPWWINTTTRVLDVGCGNDTALAYFHDNGITSLLGIDPYISQSYVTPRGIELRKQSISETKGTWDIIIVNHVLEHEAQPIEFLRHVRRLLASGGICIIGTPIIPNAAYQQYGSNWVQIDAPRHLVIHSQKSLAHCAREVGLVVNRITYDSSPFQFWGSDNYARGIPLRDNPYRIISINPLTLFKSLYWRIASRILNAQQRGDSVVAYLSSSDDTGSL